MFISPIFTPALATYSGTRSVYADRMAAQRAANAGNQQADEVKNTVAAINTEQFFADKAARVASLEQAQSGQSTGSGSNKSAQAPANSGVAARDAGKPQSPSGDVLDLSEGAQQAEKSEQSEQTDESSELSTPNSARDAEKSDDSRVDDKSLKSGEKETVESGQKADSGKKSETEDPNKLTPEQEAQITKLKARDAEVKAHEAAHLAAAGAYAQGGPSYTYQTGPDGNKYAIGGEVSIDSSPVEGDPEATIQKARQIQSAALAPANPSSQDQKVAAAAARMMSEAQMQLSQQRTDEMKETSEKSDSEKSDGALKSDKTDESDGLSSTQSVFGKSDVSDKSDSKDPKTEADVVQFGMRPNDVKFSATEDLSKSLNDAEKLGNKEESKNKSSAPEDDSDATSPKKSAESAKKENFGSAMSASTPAKLSSVTNQYAKQSMIHAETFRSGMFQAIG